MNTTYNEIFQSFLLNCKYNPKDIPTNDVVRYEMIKNAVKHYNNKRRTTIQCDDTTETISEILDDDGLIILSHCMRLIFLKNELTYFTSIFSTFQKEIGFKDYKAQLEGKQVLIKNEESTIEDLIQNTIEDWEI